MLFRTFIGPAEEAKIDTEYHTGKIKRGQRIRVTEKEAAAMDKLPDTWKSVPSMSQLYSIQPKEGEVAEKETVLKTVKVRKRTRTKAKKKGRK